MAQHFHVVENTPGCLPDADPEVYATRTMAELAAGQMLRAIYDEMREEYPRPGLVRRSGSLAEGLVRYESPRESRVVEIQWCLEARPECLQ